MIFSNICCYIINTINTGGSYGFVRVTLGPFPGFLVGCLEVLANWVFVVEIVSEFGEMIHHMVGGGPEFQPVWWLFYFIPAVAILMGSSKYFWPVCIFLGVLSLLLVLIYVLAVAKELDTQKYVVEEDNRFFPDGAASFFIIISLTAHQWLGLQSVSLSCEDIKDVRMLSFLFRFELMKTILTFLNTKGIDK